MRRMISLAIDLTRKTNVSLVRPDNKPTVNWQICLAERLGHHRIAAPAVDRYWRYPGRPHNRLTSLRPPDNSPRHHYGFAQTPRF